MGQYLKKYCASLGYLIIFGSTSFLYWCRPRYVMPIVESIAATSLCNLFIAFYCLVYYILRYAQRKSSLLYHEAETQSESGRDMITSSTKGMPEVNSFSVENATSITTNTLALPQPLVDAADTPKSLLILQSIHHWYQACSFSYAVFCLSYSLQISNLNASFFLCVGTCLSSFGGNPMGGKHQIRLRVIHWSALIIFLFCFFLWIYNYHFLFLGNTKANNEIIGIGDPLFANSSTNETSNASATSSNTISMTDVIYHRPYLWRNVWFEMAGPFMAPFYMSYFKTKKAHLLLGITTPGKVGPGDTFFLFSLPFLGLMSMTFLSIFLPSDHASTVDVQQLLGISDLSSLDRFMSVLNSCVAVPIALFFALVIYVGAIGKTEYAVICSSSLTLIFFSCSNIVLPEHQRNNNIIVPCIFMSLVGFFLTLLVLIMDVYRRECEMHSENETSYSFSS